MASQPEAYSCLRLRSIQLLVNIRSNTMTDAELCELGDIAKALVHWRQELERYNAEEHLHKETQQPWINIVMGNHPTYLLDMNVAIERPQARAKVRQIMLEEIEHKIKSLTSTLNHLRANL
jgi:hypothetical protein